MGANRPLLLALAISVIGHIAFALLFPVSDSERRVARFDVVLVPQAPAAVVQPTEALSVEQGDDPPEASEPPEEVAARDEPSLSQSDVIPDETTPDEPRKPTAILNLNRPSDWDEIVNEIRLPAGKLAFNPSLGEAIQQRIGERRRGTFVANRRAAIYGVTDEDYARTGALGEELKMKGGCVTLMENKGVEEGQRWWASQCTETRQNPFTLPEVEYDALGRAVVD